MTEIIPFDPADIRQSVRRAVIGLYTYENAGKALAWLAKIEASEREVAKLSNDALAWEYWRDRARKAEDALSQNTQVATKEFICAEAIDKDDMVYVSQDGLLRRVQPRLP